jgi:starch phosphorylase
LDGWWREAYNGQNGWSIGQDRDLGSPAVQDEEDITSLYKTLEESIIPMYYERNDNDMSREWVARIKESLRTNIPRFSTRRMVKEYVERLYVKALK